MTLKKYKYVVVEGNIGAGKTSLAQKLSADLGTNLILEEFAENTFLHQFYEHPEKYAFPLEMSFLAARYQQLTEAIEKQGSNTIISDYHLQKSLLFARVNLDPAELRLYESFFTIISSKLPQPELVIFLQKDVKHLQENISKRGRDFERKISNEYLNKINLGYSQLLPGLRTSKVLEIHSDDLDFIKNKQDYNRIIDLINNV